jgi:hypothetical protein
MQLSLGESGGNTLFGHLAAELRGSLGFLTAGLAVGFKKRISDSMCRLSTLTSVTY